MSEPRKLTAQQQLFVHEYLIDLNATQAAIRAQYSEDSAASIGSELMQKPHIKIAVQNAMSARSKRTDITADLVLQEILKAARVDIADIFTEKGDLKDIRDIPEDTRRAIAAIEVNTMVDNVEGEDGESVKQVVGHTKKIKFNDKLKALELLGRHLKLFTDKIEVDGKLTLEQLVAGSHEKKDE